MNCFQNSVSLIPTTTSAIAQELRNLLWIAFRIQYLWYQQQQSQPRSSYNACCELLSEFSIFDTNNNNVWTINLMAYVVNCFQNSVSLIPTTTKLIQCYFNTMLWIAFRIQYLWYQQQHKGMRAYWQSCCELLSEFSIFDTNNNCEDLFLKLIFVVNCFQNSVSLIPTTTLIALTPLAPLLWIAFRIQYLWYQQQH